MISPHNPIFNKDSVTNSVDLMITPIAVATMASWLFPMASSAEERGDWIYWNRQIGAKNLMYAIPSAV